MEKIVKNGLRDCTVNLDGSECAVKFDSCFRAFAVRNDGAADVFISKTSGIVPDDDGVMCVKSGASAVFAHMDIYADTVYLLGNGRVQVHAQNDSANPFNYAPTFDGGVMAEGNPVVMDNLQEGVPFSEMVVSGKNLLPAMSNSVTQDGITYTVNANGTVTLNGTAENEGRGVDIVYKAPLKAGVYTLSGCPEGGGTTSFALRVGLGTKNTLYDRDYGNGLKITAKTDTFITVTIQNLEIGRVYDDVVFRPQLELGSTPTEYEPPITGRGLTVNVSGVSGKNLFDGNLIIGMIQTSTGIMTGGSQYLSTPNYISVNGDCTYSLSNFENKQFDAVVFYDSNKSYISATPLNRVEPLISHFTTPKNCKYIRWRYYFDNAASIDMLSEIQLEPGDTATAYEPYHGSTTTITPDSNPYTIPNDIRQQDGLNVVSVSAGKISVTGVRKNAAIKRIWDEIDEIKTAIIVSNGESE